VLLESRPNAQLESTELRRELSARVLVVQLALQDTIARLELQTLSSIHALLEDTVQRDQELSHAQLEPSMTTSMEEASVTASLAHQVMSAEPCRLIEDLLAQRVTTAQEDLQVSNTHAQLEPTELADVVRET